MFLSVLALPASHGGDTLLKFFNYNFRRRDCHKLTEIAVGNTFQRLIAKLSWVPVRSVLVSKFFSRRVGFATPCRCEASAHATRTFTPKNRHRHVVVIKICFRNAFNANEIQYNHPSIYPFLWQCYSSLLILFYCENIILSQNGAQQGDHCGQFFFVEIHRILMRLYYFTVIIEECSFGLQFLFTIFIFGFNKNEYFWMG